MAVFGSSEYGDSVFGSSSSPATESPSRIAWKFFDNIDTYFLPVNPASASMPTKNKKVSFRATTSGRQVIFEGKPEVETMTFSGVILNEAQYTLWKLWASKRKQIQITDDLGQKFWVYITSFKPVRQKSNSYDWFMNYSVEATVVDRGAI